jgi:hypothetical protein
MPLLWIALITNIAAVVLLLAWAITGRSNQLMLRIAGFCCIVGVVAGFIATR